MSKKAFEKVSIGGMELKNRFIRSAAGSGIASIEGLVTEDVLSRYETDASGEPGLLITEMMTVWDDGNFPAHYLRIDNDRYIDGLKNLTSLVQKKGVKIISQLGNYGSLLHWKPVTTPLGASAVKHRVSGITPREMDDKDIAFVVGKFTEAAFRSKEAGFNGVQIHCAHGFLLNQFVSSYYNRREDRYGGSLENRIRIVIEILDAVKKTCGRDYPVYLKINVSDFSDDILDWDFDESRLACALLAEAGYDSIELSGGVAGAKVNPARSIKEEAWYRHYGEIISSEIESPVILVGGIRRFKTANDILQHSEIEAIGMTRALTRDPDLLHHWKNGDYRETKCNLCNKCFTTEGQKCIFRI